MNTPTTTPVTDGYVPGVCNINRAEIAYRKKAGYVGLAITLVLLVALLALPITRYLRLALFLPAFVAVIGYLQAKNRFCVGYGAAGQQNATDGHAKAETITDVSAVQKDKARARKMNLQAAAAAAIFAVITVLLPQMS